MALKSTRYRKVAPATLERREAVRHQVKITRLSLKSARRRSMKAVLQDVSIYGCRLEARAIFREQEEVEIVFSGREPVTAKIVWQKAEQSGCRFAASLCPEFLRSLTLAN